MYCMAYEAEDTKPRSRPTKTRQEEVENDFNNLDKSDAMDRKKWRPCKVITKNHFL